MRGIVRRCANGALLFCGSAMLAGMAAAATCTWTGGGANANWATPGNWNNAGNACHGLGTSVPGAGDDLVFPAGAARLSNSNNLAADTVFNSINFTGGGYTVGGNRIALNGGAITQALSASGWNTLGTDLLLNGLASVSIQGTAGSSLALSGTVSGSGGINAGGAATIQNSLTLNPPAGNSYSGGTWLSQLFVYPAHEAAFGSGAVTIPDPTVSATIQLSGFAIANAASFAGHGIGGNGVINGLTGTWSGPITLLADTGMGTSGNLSVTGKISGGFGLMAPLAGGGGSITLTADNDYTGPTTVSGSGKLTVNGSQAQSSVTVQPNCTLAGQGSVGPVSLDPSGARLAPGGGVGILNTGSLALPAGSQLAVELNGVRAGLDYDQVNAGGTVTLGGSLAVTLGYVPFNGSSFTIIKNDGVDLVAGTFAGLPEGSSFVVGGVTFKIRYGAGSGNDVVLSVTSGGKAANLTPELLLLELD